jgi:RNA polymerase sigma-70 factor (ECF subfamily)
MAEPPEPPQESIEALLQRHLPELRSYVARRADRLVLSRESRSDLVQSVCREVIEHIERFEHREGDSFRHWLIRTAERKIIDRYRYYTADRRDALREIDGPDGAAGSAPARDPSPSQHAAAVEQSERLAAALDELPEHYRDVIRLARLDALPLAQVAQRMSRSEDSVRNLLFRAIGLLSDRLAAPSATRAPKAH